MSPTPSSQGRSPRAASNVTMALSVTIGAILASWIFVGLHRGVPILEMLFGGYRFLVTIPALAAV